MNEFVSAHERETDPRWLALKAAEARAEKVEKERDDQPGELCAVHAVTPLKRLLCNSSDT
jgi:hypothetical protein